MLKLKLMLLILLSSVSAFALQGTVEGYLASIKYLPANHLYPQPQSAIDRWSPKEDRALMRISVGKDRRHFVVVLVKGALVKSEQGWLVRTGKITLQGRDLTQVVDAKMMEEMMMEASIYPTIDRAEFYIFIGHTVPRTTKSEPDYWSRIWP